MSGDRVDDSVPFTYSDTCSQLLNTRTVVGDPDAQWFAMNTIGPESTPLTVRPGSR